MKIIIFNRKALYIICIVLVISIILSIILFNNYKTTEIFNMDLYYQGTLDEKVIAFACNVDWGNDYIPLMLEIFEKADTKITFFLTGKWAEKNEDLVMSIYDHGHEIGNHGYSHIDYDKLSLERNMEEISKAHLAIRNITNEDPYYFAPPSGAFNDNTIIAARELGYKTILWSIDTIDWRKDSKKDIIIKRVKDKLHNSAIVLMHPTKETVKALPEMIDFIFQNGYIIGTINDVLVEE